MLWQDLVIGGAGVVFAAALVPQALRGFRERQGLISAWTSVPTFLALFTMTVAYVTLGLFLSAVVLFVTGLLWLLLFIQRLVYRR